MAKDIDALDDFVEEKLYNLHTNFIAKIIRATDSKHIDVVPMTKTKQIGKEPKAQAVLKNLSCTDQVWPQIDDNSLVICAVCERDITDAVNGKSVLPAYGRHNMKDSVIIGTLDGKDESATGSGDSSGRTYDSATAQKIFAEGEKYIGMKYTFGGTAPKSFDCSGFVQWVMRKSGISVGRTAQDIYNGCTRISAAAAQPGDLVFFTRTYNAGRTVTHVGIYAGNNEMLHCGDPIGYTNISSSYWQQHLYAFGRPH